MVKSSADTDNVVNTWIEYQNTDVNIFVLYQLFSSSCKNCLLSKKKKEKHQWTLIANTYECPRSSCRVKWKNKVNQIQLLVMLWPNCWLFIRLLQGLWTGSLILWHTTGKQFQCWVTGMWEQVTGPLSLDIAAISSLHVTWPDQSTILYTVWWRPSNWVSTSLKVVRWVQYLIYCFLLLILMLKNLDNFKFL